MKRLGRMVLPNLKGTLHVVVNDFIFHPVLWSLPFIALTLLNVHLIVTQGIFGAKMSVISFSRHDNSYTITILSLLFLWGLVNFGEHGNPMKIYLALSTTFASYGAGEIVHKFLVFNYQVAEVGFIGWFATLGYELIFILANLPLFFVANKKPTKTFIALMLLTLGAYVVFDSMLLSTVGIDPESLAYTNVWYPAQTVYFLARTFSILGYAVLVTGMSTLENIGAIQSYVWWLTSKSFEPASLPYCSHVNRRMACYFCPHVRVEKDLDNTAIICSCKIAGQHMEEVARQ